MQHVDSRSAVQHKKKGRGLQEGVLIYCPCDGMYMKCDQDEYIEQYGSSIGDGPGLLYMHPDGIIQIVYLW